MGDKFVYVAKPEDEGYAIKDILRHNFTFSSRLRTKLKQNKAIYLNGEQTEGWIKPKAGDVISVRLPEERSDFEPEDIPVEVIYEDDDILVLNKRPGVVVHPTLGQPNHTMANAIMKYMIDRGDSYKIRFVNRLDRDTSGVLLIAKNSYSQEELTKQMKANETRKYYNAVLCGIIEEDSGKVDKPIGRPDPERIERGILPEEEGGYASVTHFRVLSRRRADYMRLDPSLTMNIGFIEGPCESRTEAEMNELEASGLAFPCDGLTAVELLLETGRTHQIRVHMGSCGHFVLGDSLYGGVLQEESDSGEYVSIAGRQLLHARRMLFKHPVTGVQMDLEAPLPPDFTAFFKD